MSEDDQHPDVGALPAQAARDAIGAVAQLGRGDAHALDQQAGRPTARHLTPATPWHGYASQRRDLVHSGHGLTAQDTGAR